MGQLIDFVGFIDDNGGKGKFKLLPEVRRAFARWEEGQRIGDKVFLRILEVTHRRSDQHHRLYRLRNSILAAEIGCTADSLHVQIFMDLEFGKWLTVTEEREVVDKETGEISIRPAVRIFDRRSVTTLSTQEMNACFYRQDEIAMFENEDRDPENQIILPSGSDRNPPPEAS
jgi:hypothetical protein